MTQPKQLKSTAWFDQADALDVLQKKLSAGSVSESLKNNYADFINNGYTVLSQRVEGGIIDKIVADFDDAKNNREKILMRKGGRYKHPGPLGVIGRRMRVIDFYVPCQAALQAALADPVCEFLTGLYDESPLAFQQLFFQFGSKQTMHQDYAYVITDRPGMIVATWIALEDIQPGSGELMYYKGSHRDIQMTFEGGKEVWDRNADSIDENLEGAARLDAMCQAAGLEKQQFQAKKGDVLVWHANLVHGGSDITDEELTRKSLVTHYCPVSGNPRYFQIHPDYTCKREYGKGFYASRHYDIRPESNNPFPVYTGGEDISL